MVRYAMLMVCRGSFLLKSRKGEVFMTNRAEIREKASKVVLPFLKDKSEPDEAWYCCLQYVFMGSTRTMLDAYRLYAGKNCKYLPNSVRQWAKKFNWTDRVKLFDKAQDGERKDVVRKAIAKITRGDSFDYNGIFQELKNLVIDDLVVDSALQTVLNQEIEEMTQQNGEISTNKLKELVLIRKELLNGRKMAIEQAAAVYGFGIVSGSEIVDAEVLEG
jgi:hypothetical protein